MPFTCYLIIGTLLGILGVTQNNKGFLYSSGLALSLAGWTRPEGIGFAFFLACLVVIFAWKQQIKRHHLLAYLLITIFFCGTWMALGVRYFQGAEIGTTIHMSIQALTDGTFSPGTF
jgi:predicted neutral ceramidase superfamily lipid hydrolase